MHHGLLTKNELIDYAIRLGSIRGSRNLQSIEDEGQKYMNQWNMARLSHRLSLE
jgi:hypothetical protein